jgi:hypothetical protein
MAFIPKVVDVTIDIETEKEYAERILRLMEELEEFDDRYTAEDGEVFPGTK